MVGTLKLLAVFPHPDDETLGAGGFMKRAHDAGAKVSVVIATDGNKHGLKEIRRQETVAALGVLGIPQTDIRFLDYPDGHLQAHKAELSANIKTIVSDTKPTIILGTHPADTHPDHAVVGRVLDDLVPQLQPRPLIYEFLVHYHRYPRPEGYHPSDYLLPPAKLLLATTPWQKFVLAPADQSAKYKAVLAYKSQLSRKNPLLRGLLFSFIRQNELFVINR